MNLRHYKIIFINLTLFVLICDAPFAMNSTILHCLGKEESIIHRAKSDGPLYKLNQALINKLSSISSLNVKEEYLQKICNPQDFSPSVEFLRIGILYEMKAFQTKGVSNFQKGQLKSLLEDIPHLLFNYLSSLQALSPKAKCLKEKIPELAYFIERYRYLETDYPAKRLLEEKGKVQKLFNGLKRLDKIMAACKKEAKKSAP